MSRDIDELRDVTCPRCGDDVAVWPEDVNPHNPTELDGVCDSCYFDIEQERSQGCTS